MQQDLPQTRRTLELVCAQVNYLLHEIAVTQVQNDEAEQESQTLLCDMEARIAELEATLNELDAVPAVQKYYYEKHYGSVFGKRHRDNATRVKKAVHEFDALLATVKKED